MKFILGKKIEMSQLFDDEGNIVPVTLIEAGPCYVTQVKTKEKDGYDSVQIGFERLKEKEMTKSKRKKPYKYIKEFRIKESAPAKSMMDGDKIDVSVFEEGEKVKVSSFSKGKGFAGGVKRWGFKGASASHGSKHVQRKIGSVGSMFPQRVIKGRKMPGRMGFERVTVKNLKVVKVDRENNILAIKGAVPGRRGTLVEIRG